MVDIINRTLASTVNWIDKNTLLYKKYIALKSYSKKNGISLVKAGMKARVFSLNYERILRSVKINDVGVGGFFYSIDENILIATSGDIIDNIPIDYSVVLNGELEKNAVFLAVQRYVKRVNDSRVTLDKPRNLKEALQSILLWNQILWQTGHRLNGLGRLDKVLADYEVPDNGKDIIKNFLLTLHKNYEFKSSSMLGDTGQIIIVGGKEEDGKYFENIYTHLFIECLEELKIPDPKVLLRVSSVTPKRLLDKAVKCIASGIGSPLLSNDDVIINDLIKFGYKTEDAYNYGVSACWEPLSIGNSLEQNNLANIKYGLCAHQMIIDDKFDSCVSFEEVYQLFLEKLDSEVQNVIAYIDSITWQYDPLLSLLFKLKKDISLGGAEYNNYGVLTIGLSSAVNSLLNIKRFGFGRKYSNSELKDVITSNYIKQEDMTLFSKNENGFGTDCEEAIELTNSIIKFTEGLLKDYHNKYGGHVKFGLSSPAYIEGSKFVGATLDGRKKNQPFNTHISRDKIETPTELMIFASKLCFSGTSCNANVVDYIVSKNLITNNIKKFSQLVCSGMEMGVFQLQDRKSVV